MKKFTINCSFGSVSAPFTVYIGNPEAKHHPLHFQAEWLSKERGGSIPQEVMDSLIKLQEIALKNGVAFEELCAYALEAAAAPAVSNKEDEQKKVTNKSEDDNKAGG